MRAAEHESDRHAEQHEGDKGLLGHEVCRRDDPRPQGQRPEHRLGCPHARGDPAEDQGAEEGNELDEQDERDQLRLLELQFLGAIQA